MYVCMQFKNFIQIKSLFDWKIGKMFGDEKLRLPSSIAIKCFDVYSHFTSLIT